MKNETRIAFNTYTQKVAQLNGVGDASVKFAVEPSVEQKLEQKIQETSDFLQRINIVGVPELKGSILGMMSTGPIASRTDTNATERSTKDVTGLDKRDYECVKTDFDTHVKYDKLDQWAKFPNFQTMMRDKVVEEIARNRLMIGFNGTSRAANTDPVTNPLLQDVNIGWLEHMRTDKPENVLMGLQVHPTLAGSDYKNIDAMVMDALDLLDPWFQDDPSVVVVCGRSVVSDKYTALANDNNAPSEKTALNTLMTNKVVGGKRVVMVPFFPANSLMLTPLDNLSIYWQEGSRRRAIIDNPKKDQIEDFQSVNEDYVVEDLGAAGFIEGIVESW